MGGSRNLVIFLGIALVIVRFLTSSQRSALAGLWSAGASSTTSGASTVMQSNHGSSIYQKGGGPSVGSYSVARGGRWMSITSSPSTPHDALEQIGLELAAVAVTAVIAGTGPKAAHAMVALWLLLWVLFLITKYAT